MRVDASYDNRRDMLISPSELYDTYLYGIRTKAPDGSDIADSVLSTYILSAQEELEKYLGIKFCSSVISETHDYDVSDSNALISVYTDYPVKDVVSLSGYYSDKKILDVPKEWLAYRKSSEGVFDRKVDVVPSALSSTFAGGNGIAFFSMYSGRYVPNFWHIEYISGFSKIQNDLLNFVGKLAAINVFNLLGDLILGAGIASQSISIDGLSQSISTTSSAENSGYSSRVKAYLEDLKVSLPRLESLYRDIGIS